MARAESAAGKEGADDERQEAARANERGQGRGAKWVRDGRRRETDEGVWRQRQGGGCVAESRVDRQAA